MIYFIKWKHYKCYLTKRVISTEHSVYFWFSVLHFDIKSAFSNKGVGSDGFVIQCRPLMSAEGGLNLEH